MSPETRGFRSKVVAVVATTLVACTLLGAMCWQLQRDAGRTLGIEIRETPAGVVVDGVRPDGPSQRAGIRPGDRVVAINARPVSDLDGFNRPWSELERGVPAAVTVARDGRQLTVPVAPGVPMPWLRFLIVCLAALAHLGLAGLALLSAPQDHRARLLFVLASAIAVELALPESLEIVPGWPTLFMVLFYLLTGLQLAVELHLATEIPTRQGWSDRPWLRPLFYGIGLVVAVGGAGATVVRHFATGGAAKLAAGLLGLIDSAGLDGWAIAVVVILVVQLRGAASDRQRHQARLVLAGVIPWALYTFTFEMLFRLGVPTPDLFGLLQPLSLLLYPVAFFLAMFYYHLFDLHFVLRRSLVFTIVTLGLAGLFMVAFHGARVAFADNASADDPSVAALCLAMLVLGLLFAPLRRYAQGWVDRRLYPEQVAIRSSLTELAADLPSQGNLAAMGRHLVNGLTSQLGLSSVTVLVADPRSRVLVTLASSAVDVEATFGQSMLLEPDDPGVRLLRRSGQPVPADQIAAVSQSLALRMRAFQSELAIGLVRGEVVVGVLLLGGKVSGDRFHSEEMELFTLFSHTVATVLENARLFESATYESLTGLMRREAILAALERELHRARRYRRPLTVGMVDIDFFKGVNDRYGHLAGDALLKRVARTLAEGLRSSDSIGRYGGEEFLFFLPETDLNGAVQVAEKLRRNVEEIRDAVESAPEARVTVSIGLSQLDHGDDRAANVLAMVDAADRSLLRAKRCGRNRVVASTAAA